jgi:hypothetical protein
MLEYTQIYSIFPCQAGAEVLRARRAGAQTTLLTSIKNIDNNYEFYIDQHYEEMVDCCKQKKSIIS